MLKVGAHDGGSAFRLQRVPLVATLQHIHLFGDYVAGLADAALEQRG
jgi:hypothetical protein